PPGGLRGATHDVELFALDGLGGFRTFPASLTVPVGGPREYVYAGPVRTANTVACEATRLPVIVETEPNDALANAMAISASQAVFGRLSAGNDEDWYSVPVQNGQALTIDCRPLPAGSGSLPVISVCDANGGVLARASTVELAPKPCRLEWRAPADGTYRIRVQELRQGGAATPYLLEVRTAQPDFAVTATADLTNVVQGGRGELELRVDRQGGFAAPIDLHVAGLPAGVKVEPLQVPAGVETLKIAFIASDDARPGDSILNLSASAKVGEETVSHDLTATHLGHDLEGVSLGSPTTEHVQLTVRHKQVFRLFCSEAYQYAHRGTIYPYLMEVERMNGFEGEIRIDMGDRQIMDLDGVQIVNSVLPAGKSQFMLPLYLPETMHINVQPHSNIYAQGYVIFQDKWGQRQSMVQVSEMRCMIRPLPTVAKLRVRDKSLTVAPGHSASCILEIDRTTNFPGALRVELLNPPAGWQMPAVTIPAEQSTATATITAAAGQSQPGATQLTLRGTGELSPGVTVVTEAILPVILKGTK
ncbi:MAG: PPC domain-containing protein, partial [Planctomycetes bacterium]|nr:PPC domain-containing protein [Planctomycetota bacterium]